MEIEYNKENFDGDFACAFAMSSPSIDENFWIMRVPLSETQAIIVFPHHVTLAIGFQLEEDWNTNAPFTDSARDIYHHICHNKGDVNISDDDCIEAIEMIRKEIHRLLSTETPLEETAK